MIKNNIDNNKKVWGDPKTWTQEGHEWSGTWESTDDLYYSTLHSRISPLLHGDVLEIAPGYGRITEYLIKDSTTLDIVDLNKNCIDFCKQKFGSKIQNYYINGGKDLWDINSNSKDFVFSWDSFVHMSENVIQSYLYEINRVLKPGGKAWIHHSNLFNGDEDNFKNYAGRANMTVDRFKELSEIVGLRIVNQEYFRWHNETHLELYDGFTTLLKTQLHV